MDSAEVDSGRTGSTAKPETGGNSQMGEHANRDVGRSDLNRPFPWVVSDFGLIDAIESGLVKIPQLAVRDSTGAPIPGYFNIWRWILPKLTPGERGAQRNPKPEAILKWANTPIVMLAGQI